MGRGKVCSRKELESLIGLLNHACKVVRPGRTFLRRMIDLLHARSLPTHAGKNTPIRLNAEFRADLSWWQCFTQSWNGSSFLPTPPQLPQSQVASDASGHWGCGAWGLGRWFQVQWNPRIEELPITVKELIPILIAGVVWGQTWSGHQVQCLCDNQAVVACIRSRTSRHKGLIHLLRNLLYIEATFNFQYQPQYIDTHSNDLADDLSRNRAASFLSKVPLADHRPTQIPPGLMDLLLDTQADWTSRQWRQQFRAILNRAWLQPPTGLTRQQ